MIVSKFGGTSVADAEAITRTAEIIRGRLDRRPVVVVSAMAGVTNDLLALAEHAVQGQLLMAMQSVEALRRRHFAAAEQLLRPAQASELCAEMSVMFDELASLAGALSVLGHLTPRSLDAVAATGELLSSQIVVAAYIQLGLDAGLVDARQVVVTDDDYTKAAPQPEAILAAARETILPLLRDGRVPVLGGFVGATASGITTITLKYSITTPTPRPPRRSDRARRRGIVRAAGSA